MARVVLMGVLGIGCGVSAQAQKQFQDQGGRGGESPPGVKPPAAAPEDVAAPAGPRTLAGRGLVAPRPREEAAPTPLVGEAAPGAPSLTWRSDPSAWERWWYSRRGEILDSLDAVVEAGGPRTEASDPDGRQAVLAREEACRRAAEVLVAGAGRLAADSDARVVRERLIAIGRLGEAAGPAGVEALASWLDSPQRELAETAVLGLGLTGSLEGAVRLASLVRDDAQGRDQVGSTRVDGRTRAFACYALALAARRSARPEVVRFAAHHLVWLLEQDEREDDLEAAIVLALGLLPPDSPGLDGAAVVDALLARLSDDRSPRMIRAHAPASLARLAAPHPALRERVARALMALVAPHAREDQAVRTGAVLALGLLGDADGEDLDREVRASLAAVLRKGEGTERRYAAMALAEVGSRPGSGAAGERMAATREVERLLVDQLLRGPRGERPWAGLALGWLGGRLRRDGVLVEQATAEALLSAVESTRTPSDAAAYGLGCGLIGDRRSQPAIAERFARTAEGFSHQQLALSLGLLGDRASVELLQEDVSGSSSSHRVEELEWSAFARALLGDERLPGELVQRLSASRSTAEIEGCARALAWNGGTAVAIALLARLESDERAAELPAAGRAAVVRALGWILDADGRAWDNPLAPGLNFSLVPDSLASETGTGVLDSL